MKDLVVVEAQLARILSFFPRVEGRITGLFATNTLFLALGALNVDAVDLPRWYVSVPAFVALIAIFFSYVFLFQANFPDVKGGSGSIIYFAEIQKRTETNYTKEFLDCSEEDYRTDMIGQIWRNSQILCEKYMKTKYAIICTAAALPPFVIFLAVTATIHGRMPILKG